MLCFAEESAVEAQGPALHKLNELYATWWGLPETQTLANGLLQRLRQHQQPASAESSGTLRLELLPEAAHVEVQQLLWDRTPPPPGPWDLVIGSDVTFMYDPEAHAALAATLGAMLRSPDPPTTAAPPRVLLAHEHRNRGPGDAPARWDASDETLRRFQAAAREHALRVEQLRAERVGTHQVSIIEVLREE